jgi:hypothetical protein
VFRDGKLTWLIVMALQRGNTPQRETLEECYGTGREEDAIRVREIYEKLNLSKTFRSVKHTKTVGKRFHFEFLLRILTTVFN